MPTVSEIMTELEGNGSESIKKILLKHGVKEPFFGVKIEFLKPIQKKVKMDYQLAKGLYATGNADAMYLAGLIADDKQMSWADLELWAEQAVSNNIAEYTVPWVAAESNFGWELGLKWIDSDVEHIAVSGWYTLSNLSALKPDAELDLATYRALLARVEENIHLTSSRLRKVMNNFVIAVGTFVPTLTAEVVEIANRIGDITVDKDGTACKVPGAIEYINKAKAKGAIGKKKKTVKC